MSVESFRRLLVVSAHAADFVWRAAGYIAVVTSAFGETGSPDIQYAEAYQRVFPQVSGVLG